MCQKTTWCYHATEPYPNSKGELLGHNDSLAWGRKLWGYHPSKLTIFRNLTAPCIWDTFSGKSSLKICRDGIKESIEMIQYKAAGVNLVCYLSCIWGKHRRSFRESSISIMSNSSRVSVQSLLNDEKVFARGNSNEFVCTIDNCNRKFISNDSLSVHQKRCHSPPTAHVCSQCKSSFSTIPNLNKHVSDTLESGTK